MRKIVLSVVLITSLLSSCNSPKTENNGPQTFHIDLNAANDEADKLCKRMEMRLLPLESNDHSIFNDESAKMHVKGNTMIVEDPSQDGHIFVFDNQGNFIRHWNRLGQGDEEYTCRFSMISMWIVYWKLTETQVMAFPSPLAKAAKSIVIVGAKFKS